MSVTVVIPNYNHGKLIARAVLALMAQVPAPAEIIIVNDASTDDSLTVIARLQAKFSCIRLINHEHNKGVVAGMNEGLHAANHALVYFAAADDYTMPGFFAAAKRAFERYPGAAFFCGRVVLVDPDGKILGFRPFMQPAAHSVMLTPAMVRAKLKTSDNWSVGPSVVYARGRLIDNGGFDENMGAFTDGHMVRLLALQSGFYFDTAVVAAWERYPESYSAKTALSTKDNVRLIGSAVAAVKASFPPDIRDAYADWLGRRLRFNMARLWLVFDEGRVDSKGLADVLQFKGAARSVLGLCARLPFPRLAVLSWMALVLRPYGVGAILAGWYRTKAAAAGDTASVAAMIADARARSM